MASTIQARIADLLMGAIDGISGQTVAWPNVPFEPAADQTYLRPSVLFSDTEQPGLAHESYRRFQGILQISLFAPRGAGIVTPADSLGLVLGFFERGTRFTDADLVVEIGPEPSRLDSPVQEDAWWHQPATIPWFAIVTE